MTRCTAMEMLTASNFPGQSGMNPPLSCGFFWALQSFSCFTLHGGPHFETKHQRVLFMTVFFLFSFFSKHMEKKREGLRASKRNEARNYPLPSGSKKSMGAILPAPCYICLCEFDLNVISMSLKLISSQNVLFYFTAGKIQCSCEVFFFFTVCVPQGDLRVRVL